MGGQVQVQEALELRVFLVGGGLGESYELQGSRAVYSTVAILGY
jgi:hypothetical protein